MPCTRSMRSKPSSKRDEEEMPPPAASTRPTRTRNKKTAKSQADDDEVPGSPTPSSSSSRSTRSRTGAKTKAKPDVVEIIDVASPAPVRVTRSTRQRAAKTASKAKKAEEDPVPKSTPLKVQPEQKVTTTKAKAKKTGTSSTATATKRTRSKAKAKKYVESTTEDDDFSNDEASEVESKSVKTINIEAIHKCFVAPIQTAFRTATTSDISIEKLFKGRSREEQRKAFEDVLNGVPSEEMPPPPPPATKEKRQKKRARSPEETPAKTVLPESFDFARSQSSARVPAKKKFLMDLPTPTSDDSECEIIQDDNANVKKKKSSSSESVASERKEKETKTASKKEKQLKSNKVDNVKLNGATEAVKEDVKEKGAETIEIKSSSPTAEDPNATFVLPSVPSASVASKKSELNNLNVTVCVKKGSKSPTSEVRLDEETPKQASPETEPRVQKSDPRLPTSSTLFSQDLSRTFVKEPSLAALEEEEDEEISSCSTKGAKVRPPIIKQNEESKESKKGLSSSESVPLEKKEKEVKTASKKEKKTISNEGDGGKLSGATASVKKDTKDKGAETNKSKSSSTVAEDPNATYVLPSASAESKKSELNNLNVTVCVKKGSKSPTSEVGLNEETPKQKQASPEPCVQKLDLHLPTSSTLFSQDLSRTFVKEPPLAVLEEEDEGLSSCSTKSAKVRPPIIKQNEQNKESKKGLSSSSSSSSSSLKSATSNPNLSAKKPASNISKNVPLYGSASKLNEIQKSKQLEDAERRKQEFLRQRQENQKKKLEEWKKKTERNKMEEEKRKKAQIQQAEAKKTEQPVSTLTKIGTAASGFLKPKLNFGPASSAKIPPLANLPKHGFARPAPPPPVEIDLDDSFKTASTANSFSYMDSSIMEGHLSTYDITVYEDLDEDLKHRENKTIPKWASDQAELQKALFSMILLPDYHHSLGDVFPKADKSYKLFPNKVVHH